MNFRRSWLPAILLSGVMLGTLVTSLDCWHAATSAESNGIERIIEIDREYFRSMQSQWDRHEAEHPDWQRPEPTAEETYEQWRIQNRRP